MQLINDLRAVADIEKAAFFPRFFKTGKGEYGEGDVFIGVTVPNIRKVVSKHVSLSLNDIDLLVRNEIHEVRLAALLILVSQYDKANMQQKKEIVDFYLAHTKQVNNWDLVDASCYKILGTYLLDHDRSILYSLARSPYLWERRIAIVSTLAFIRKGQFEDTMRICELLLNDDHDLIHKAVGWMLREMGKKDEATLCMFLDKHASKMPRTALRYAIEKLTKKEQQNYLQK